MGTSSWLLSQWIGQVLLPDLTSKSWSFLVKGALTTDLLMVGDSGDSQGPESLSDLRRTGEDPSEAREG